MSASDSSDDSDSDMENGDEDDGNQAEVDNDGQKAYIPGQEDLDKKNWLRLVMVMVEDILISFITKPMKDHIWHHPWRFKYLKWSITNFDPLG